MIGELMGNGWGHFIFFHEIIPQEYTFEHNQPLTAMTSIVHWPKEAFQLKYPQV
jgi:hypothetical protein